MILSGRAVRCSYEWSSSADALHLDADQRRSSIKRGQSGDDAVPASRGGSWRGTYGRHRTKRWGGASRLVGRRGAHNDDGRTKTCHPRTPAGGHAKPVRRIASSSVVRCLPSDVLSGQSLARPPRSPNTSRCLDTEGPDGKRLKAAESPVYVCTAFGAKPELEFRSLHRSSAVALLLRARCPDRSLAVREIGCRPCRLARYWGR